MALVWGGFSPTTVSFSLQASLVFHMNSTNPSQFNSVASTESIHK